MYSHVIPYVTSSVYLRCHDSVAFALLICFYRNQIISELGIQYCIDSLNTAGIANAGRMEFSRNLWTEYGSIPGCWEDLAAYGRSVVSQDTRFVDFPPYCHSLDTRIPPFVYLHFIS
jgi:hypothetical protein